VSLAKVEIVGFKSFMNPVTLEFRRGITAIIGPNGCGKSNIVDAIRWVLGEQSAKQLRGVKMESVIFNGTENYKPLGYAEVSITINNEKGIFPVAYSEITISRKVYRSGISEYFINKSPCRLKDIKELFADTGTGSHSYAVIEQDMIDFVLNDTHGERRVMFEEAAGIVKYRMRREEAQRKLKLTENDLVRLEDIMDELKKQVGSLRYQVGKAKRYERIREKIKNYELILLRKELSTLLKERLEAEKELNRVLEFAKSEDFSLGELEEKLNLKRDKLSTLESRYNELQNERYELRNKLQSSDEKIIKLDERRNEAYRRIEKAKQEIENARTRLSDIVGRIEVLTAEIQEVERQIADKQSEVEVDASVLKEKQTTLGELKEQLVALKQTQLDFLHEEMRIKSSLEYYESALNQVDSRLSGLRDDLVYVEGEAKEFKDRIARLEGEIENLSAELKEKENSVEELNQKLSKTIEELSLKTISISDKREELAHEKSKYELVKGMLENLEGYSNGTRLLIQRTGERVRGPLADLIEVDKEYMPAVVASINVILDSVVVNDFSQAKEVVRGLYGEEGVSGVRIVLAEGLIDSEVDIQNPPGAVGKLKNFVRINGFDDKLVNRLFGRILLFSNLDDAFNYVENNHNRYDAVTLDGVFVCRDGSVYYGRGQSSELSLIGRRERVQEMAGVVSRLEEELRSLEGEHGKLAAEKLAIENEITSLRDAIEDLKVRLSEKIKELQEAEKNYAMKKEKVSILLNSLDEVENSRSELLSKIEETRMSLDMRQSFSEEGELSLLEEKIARLQKERDSIDARITEKKLALASLRGEYEKKLQAKKVITEMKEQFTQLIEQREMEIQQAGSDIENFTRDLELEREDVSGLAQLEMECKEKIDTIYGEIEDVRKEISDIEAKLKEQKNRRDRIFEQQNEFKVKLASLETRMRELVGRAKDMYGEDFGCYLEGMEIPLTEEELEVNEEMLANEKRKLESLGAVNLAAVEEYKEKKERLEFMMSQKEDLEKARDELNQAIRKINRRARKRFLETFEMVKKNFGETFQILFEGGEANLSLGEGTDPLEADIVITAKPKGKRLQDISLLSQGERTLTALALLFALYKTKPSPFCIFDEVDAPLDDANVKRFVKMLERFKEETQFIIITHNKRTMEIAEKLYGITMEERGVSKVVAVDMSEVEDILKSRVKTTPLIDTTISPN